MKKGILNLVGFLLFLTYAQSAFGQKPTVYVFLPTQIRPNAMQSALSTALPDLNILVLGQTNEFQRRLKEEKPHAILVAGPVLAVAENYEALLYGVRNGIAYEQYIELTANSKNPKTPKKIEYHGLLNLTGRKNSEAFASKFFPSNGKVRLKVVTKLEDLLPLLQYGLVKSILIPKRDVDFFKEKSNMNFQIITTFPMEVPLTTVAIHSEYKKEKDTIINAFNSLKPEVFKLLEVDSWKQP